MLFKGNASFELDLNSYFIDEQLLNGIAGLLGGGSGSAEVSDRDHPDQRKIIIQFLSSPNIRNMESMTRNLVTSFCLLRLTEIS